MPKNDYKYGTAEYLLEECKENVDKAIAKVGQMRAAIISIKPLSVITLGGWNNKRITGYKTSLSDYFNGNSYSHFSETNVDYIERCYKNAMEWHSKALEEVEKWHLENIPVIEHNKLAQHSVMNFMELVGIRNTYSVTDFKTPRSRTKETITKTAGFVSDLARDCQVYDGYEGVKTELKSFALKMGESRANYLAKIKATQVETAKKDKEIRLVAKAMELAAKWGLEADTNAGLIALVTDRAKDEYCESMTGVEMKQSACDECSSWEVGEHRCSCGNRRMYLEVEGNILDGFNSYPMGD